MIWYPFRYNDPYPLEMGHRHGMPLDLGPADRNRPNYMTRSDFEDIYGDAQVINFAGDKFLIEGQPAYPDFRERGQLYNVRYARSNTPAKRTSGKSIAVQLLGTFYLRDYNSLPDIFHNHHVDFDELRYQKRTRKGNPNDADERRTDICSKQDDNKPTTNRPRPNSWSTRTDCNYRDWALTRKYAYKVDVLSKEEIQDQLSSSRTDVYMENDKIPWAAVGCKVKAELVEPVLMSGIQ